VWFGGGEKKGVYSRFLLKLILGKCLAGIEFCPKEASKGTGPFDACHRDRYRESLQFLSIEEGSY